MLAAGHEWGIHAVRLEAGSPCLPATVAPPARGTELPVLSCDMLTPSRQRGHVCAQARACALMRVRLRLACVRASVNVREGQVLGGGCLEECEELANQANQSDKWPLQAPPLQPGNGPPTQPMPP
jgi:hypothetical protein